MPPVSDQWSAFSRVLKTPRDQNHEKTAIFLCKSITKYEKSTPIAERNGSAEVRRLVQMSESPRVDAIFGNFENVGKPLTKNFLKNVPRFEKRTCIYMYI